MFSNQKILLTGLPGCGKTTAVRQIVDTLKLNTVAGFYTQEIRENDTRKGFSWATLDGDTGILAHVNIKTPFSVGRYRVDVAAFEKEVVPVLDPLRADTSLFVIDEIGKMECMSGKFVNAGAPPLCLGEIRIGNGGTERHGLYLGCKNLSGHKNFRVDCAEIVTR